MFSLREYRHKPNRLADYLPWALLVAPGVVQCKDGGFLQVVRYRGPDLDSATENELVATAARLNNLLRRPGSGWSLFAEARPVPKRDYPAAEWPDPVTFLIDEERRSLFADGEYFESEYYLSFFYLPPTQRQTRLQQLFTEGGRPRGDENDDFHLNKFQSEVRRMVDLLGGLFPEAAMLSDDELLTYLHSTISTRHHPIRTPEIPMYLDAVLVDMPLSGGLEPRLGRAHLRTIGVLGFPGTSLPGMLDGLNRLQIEYRWVTRFLPMDKNEALKELNRYRRQWWAKRKGPLAVAKEAATNDASGLGDSDAVNKAEDADAALQELADDMVSYGYFTATIVLWDEDAQALDQKIRAVQQTIDSLGFATITETLNAVEAWLGTIPGHVYANVRRPILNSLNLAHLMPISAVWNGPHSNEHLDGPPLFYGVTGGGSPFRFVNHVGDVGHTLVIGPTGSGKSVQLALIQAQFRRYAHSQIYTFDKGGSALALTAGVGGEYYDLGGEDHSRLAFQPLAHIDDAGERAWAHEWILDVLRQEHVQITPAHKTELWASLNSLASAPREQRTLTGLVHLLQTGELRDALRGYTIEGPHGALLDSAGDSLHYGPWQCFEMEHLMQTPAAVQPVLSYLFHRLEARFDGRPTLLLLDEAWVFLDSPVFAPRIRAWLKVLRKSNVSVVFATQSLADVDESPITAAITESCPTRVFLPNPEAKQERSAQLYRKFGLNEREIDIIATMVPKRQYYYTSPIGNRVYELALGPIGLAYCAAAGKENQRLIHALLEEHGKAGFNDAYLRARELPWAADLLGTLTDDTVSAIA